MFTATNCKNVKIWQISRKINENLLIENTVLQSTKVINDNLGTVYFRDTVYTRSEQTLHDDRII